MPEAYLFALKMDTIKTYTHFWRRQTSLAGLMLKIVVYGISIIENFQRTVPHGCDQKWLFSDFEEL